MTSQTESPKTQVGSKTEEPDLRAAERFLKSLSQKTSVKKSRLDDHEAEIRFLVAGKASIRAIMKFLHENHQVDISRTALVSWCDVRGIETEGKQRAASRTGRSATSRHPTSANLESGGTGPRTTKPTGPVAAPDTSRITESLEDPESTAATNRPAATPRSRAPASAPALTPRSPYVQRLDEPVGAEGHPVDLILKAALARSAQAAEDAVAIRLGREPS